MTFGAGFGFPKARFPMGAGPTLDMDFAGTGTLPPSVTFSRASTGSYFDSAGVMQRATYNMLPYSEQFDNAAWGKVGMTVTANAATAPNNTVTGDKLIPDVVTGLPYTFQTITVVSGANYAWSVYLKAAGYSWVFLDAFDGANHRTWFDLSTGTIGTVEAGNTATITDVGNGWYRCTIARSSGGVSTSYAVAIVSGNNDLNITGNGVSGVFAWGAQLEQASAPGPYYATTTTANGAPRFYYDPSTLAPLGLLIEEQRTNLFIQNTNFDSISWTKLRSSITADATVSPDGTLTGDKLIASTDVNTSHFVRQDSSVTSGATYTQTLYAKAAEYTQIYMGFDGDNATFAGGSVIFTLAGSGTAGVPVGSLTSFSITPVRNGWYRCQISATAIATATAVFRIQNATGGTNNFTGDGISGVYIWGAQLEQGAFATSVIPTTTAAATRAADVAVMQGANFSNWYNPVEGTLFAEASVLSESYNQGVLVDIGAVGAFGTTEYINRASSAWILSPNTAPINVSSAVTTSSTAKIAAAIKANDSVISANGLIGSVDTTCAVPLAPTTLSIGKAGWSVGSNFLNGYIRRIAYYPRRLSNNDLQAITT